jgi:hypothetical protein
VAGQHVGFLPRPVARQVQPTLLAFSQAGEARRLVSCPAEIDLSREEPQVVLLLDPAPLGLPPEAFEAVPEMAATITRLLHSLEESAPLMTGTNQQVRASAGRGTPGRGGWQLQPQPRRLAAVGAKSPGGSPPAHQGP